MLCHVCCHAIISRHRRNSSHGKPLVVWDFETTVCQLESLQLVACWYLHIIYINMLIILFVRWCNRTWRRRIRCSSSSALNSTPRMWRTSSSRRSHSSSSTFKYVPIYSARKLLPSPLCHCEVIQLKSKICMGFIINWNFREVALEFQPVDPSKIVYYWSWTMYYNTYLHLQNQNIKSENLIPLSGKRLERS